MSLVSTKFQIPPEGINRLERHALLQKLNNALHQKKQLVLVCAPAGYGKTTLVVDWIQQLTSTSPTNPIHLNTKAIQVSWLTCEPEDGDLARFLSYLVAAVQRIDPNLGEGLLTSFHAARLPSPAILATYLINDLSDAGHPLVLVLDDFHTIASQPVHDFLAFLVEHQPPELCLVLISRADPPLPLARIRARGQLEEIRQRDLAFSVEESAAFMSRTMQVTLTRDQLLALEKRTEGWPAGLQLAALSMTSSEDVETFIDAFSGGHEYIAEYLTGEVLTQQPEAVQSFLLETSILERMSAPLCEAVTGNEDAQVVLETLREKNLFVVPLDHQKEWYRYHALFADLLRKRLRLTPATQTDELHLRASRWYQENDQFLPAIEHAFAGHAIEEAADILERAIESVFISGQVNTLLRWLELLPPDTKDRHSRLWIFHGLILAWGGKSFATVKPNLLDRVPLFTQDGLVGETDTVQAIFAMSEGRSAEAILHAERALQELSSQRALFRCLAADTLGMVKTLQMDTQGAIQAFELLIDMASWAGYGVFENLALSHLAGLHLQQGHLSAAATGYQRAVDMASQKLGKRTPVVGNALLGLGEVARERNDLDRALNYFCQSAEMFTQFSDLGVPIAQLSVARVKAAQGNWRGAQEALDQARQTMQDTSGSRLIGQMVAGLQARVWIAQGSLEAAEHWARQAGLLDRSLLELIQTAGFSGAASEFVYTDYLTLARLYLAQDKIDAAIQVIDAMLEIAREIGSVRREVHLLVLKAVAFQQKNETASALATMKRVLAMAEPENYRQAFLDEGSPMAQLLSQAMVQGHASPFARDLLARFQPGRLVTVVPEEGKHPEGLVESLSVREREVLELIAAGFSNQEICGRLHISLSTVKGHTANIYGKLGVNSRTKAVKEATNLGILKP